MHNEEWRTVVIDGEVWDNYEVSNQDGKIRNRKRNKLLKTRVDKNGYVLVDLWKNNQGMTTRVHRVVAETWILNPDNLPEVDHMDKNRQNNSVENLRWVSRQTNVHESNRSKRVKCVETGTIYNSTRQAEVETGVNHGNISQCCLGKRKTAGGYHWEFVD